ncbi:MAG: hypothetical protein HYS07_04340 [Chlamydiae bacterium]|nr:hypothetical protein [Chlamydiota bacterium]MBI3277428.1 hypothetical protein [Chlamydiota bacterium]
MKMRTVTFLMPAFIHQQLRLLVGPKKMGRFISQAVLERLSEEQKQLRQFYIKAEKDKTRKKVISEWSRIEAEHWHD